MVGYALCEGIMIGREKEGRNDEGRKEEWKKRKKEVGEEEGTWKEGKKGGKILSIRIRFFLFFTFCHALYRLGPEEHEGKSGEDRQQTDREKYRQRDGVQSMAL